MNASNVLERFKIQCDEITTSWNIAMHSVVICIADRLLPLVAVITEKLLTHRTKKMPTECRYSTMLRILK